MAVRLKSSLVYVQCVDLRESCTPAVAVRVLTGPLNSAGPLILFAVISALQTSGDFDIHIL